MENCEIKTYIVLEQLSYEKGKFHQFYRPGEHRLVFMLDEKYYRRFPIERREYFDRLEVVKDFSYSNARALVLDELQKVSSPAQVRLVCIDECNLLMVGKLREEFKIPGPTYQQLLPFRDKVKMKERLSRDGILVPRFYYPERGEDEDRALLYIRENIGFPVIAKPVDGAGSKETYEILNECEFEAFCVREKRWYEFQYEELIRGTYFHCDSIILNGRVEIAEVSQYTVPCLEFAKGYMLGSYLLQEDSPIRSRILALNKKIVESLSSWSCVTHLELFHTQTDELVFIEVAARPAGCSIPLSIENGIGINLNEVAYRMELGLPNELNKKPLKPAAWLSFPITQRGIVTETIEPILESSSTFIWKVNVGDIIAPATTSFDASLEILLSNHNQEELLKDVERLKQVNVLNVKELEAA